MVFILSTLPLAGIVVVDEAYIDFSGTTSACSLIHKYPNVIVLQTLSKAFGLAGIRLGMAIANRDIIQLMNNVKAPYNVNKLTAEVAHRALDDLSLYRSNVELILSERSYLLEALKKLCPALVKQIHHTDANFILFSVPRAQEIYKTMADSGVVCRYRSVLLTSFHSHTMYSLFPLRGTELHCTDCLRVTVGKREENDKFLALFTSTARDLGL